ncbi:hypothetical protein Tco_0735225 [Tanacetum coccineum]
MRAVVSYALGAGLFSSDTHIQRDSDTHSQFKTRKSHFLYNVEGRHLCRTLFRESVTAVRGVHLTGTDDVEIIANQDAKGFEYKHDFTVIDSSRAVTFIMRFNEIHKFSDGTLQRIDEALDYKVKEFRVNRMNPGLDTRFWTKKDVDRSKEFLFAIQKRLKARRIFRNLESFVGGRIREGDYRLLKRTE